MVASSFCHDRKSTFNIFQQIKVLLETSGVVLKMNKKQDGRFVAMVTKDLQTLFNLSPIFFHNKQYKKLN